MIKYNSKPYLLALFAVSIRLALLPWSMTTEGDAVARIFIAQKWLVHPVWMTHGIWAPLHTYLIALSLTFYKNTIVAPVLLNILFASGTAAILYLINIRFSGPRAAWIAALAFAFCPLTIRHSLTAVSETPFMFFIALSIIFIIISRERNGSFAFAALAGIALTLAGMIRYEAWAMIPFLAAMFSRKPRALILFLAMSAVFPIAWMIGNALHYGDPLYSIHAATHWQVTIEGYNENITLKTMIIRLGYFPMAIFFGFTPFVAVLVCVGMIQSWRLRHPLRIWSIPPIGLMCIYLYKALDGSLLIRGRYVLVFTVFLFPFLAFALDRLSWITSRASPQGRWRWLPATLLIGTLIPFSYFGIVLPDPFPRYFQKEIQAVPRLAESETKLAHMMTAHLDPTHDALVSDFFGWTPTAYMTLMTRIHPDRIYRTPGGRHQKPDVERLARFLEDNPVGLLALKEGSPFSTIVHNRGLDLTELQSDGETTIYRYRP